jgi:23S rRNA (uracil1939-C5)-methyltransferase
VPFSAGMAKTLRVEATIGSLAPGGDAVAHIDLDGERRAVFLRHGAPGDVLRAQIDPSRRPARGRVLAVITPGPDRVTPDCRWSVRCGGCDWMHLSLEAQSRAHVEHVRAALPPGWRDAAVVPHAAPHADATARAYRTRARLHVRAHDDHVRVGMHEAGTHEPVQVDTCVVLAPALENARKSLPRLLDGSRGNGEARIAAGVGGLAVIDLHWSGHLDASCFGRLDAAVRARELAGAQVTLEGATRPAVVGDPTPWTTAADGQPLRLPTGGFAQANEGVNAMLARHVGEIVRTFGVAGRAVELFAGAGNLSVVIARHVGELVLVESHPQACEAARLNLRARGIDARVVEANADDFDWGARTKLVVLDPPRTGARAIAGRLAATRVPYVVYVSCDTPTLERDLRALEADYEPRSVATFEMFPQTSHVETVVALARRRGPANGSNTNGNRPTP